MAGKKKRTGRRNRHLRQWIVYGVMLVIAVVCIAMIPAMNRPLDRQVTWTPAQGAAALDQAPVPETPVPSPTPTAEPTPEALEEASEEASAEDFGNFEEEAGEDMAEAPVAADEPMSEPVSLTLTFTGDCTFGGSLRHDTLKVFKKYVDDYGYDYFFQNVRSLFQSDDLTVINLEGPLTDVGTMTTKTKICFNGDPAWTPIMTNSSVEVCTFANNHNLDMGEEGFNRTLEVLANAGLGYSVYDKVYRTTLKGVRISILAFDKWTNKQPEVVEAVQQERPNCDLLIVCFHWGWEMKFKPDKDQKTMGRAIVDAGADLVIGNHPHVFSGVEKYKGKYIAYSLGNFCFGGNTAPRDQRCMLFQQTFTFENGVIGDGGINIIPCLVSGNTKKNDFQPYILDAKAGTTLLKKIASYSINGGEFKWMPGCYMEQIGLIAPQATSVEAAAEAATPSPQIVPADQVFTEEDGFDIDTPPQSLTTPVPVGTTVAPLSGLGDRTLTEAEQAQLQEEIYNDQMGTTW